MKTRVPIAIVGVVLTVLAALLGCASTQHHDPSKGQPAPFAADVETSIMTSEISRRDFQVSVALPLGYSDSMDAYPVLYAVDANGQFGTVVETARVLRFEELVPELIIVGIGYPTGGRQIHAEPHRFYDLTPTENQDIVEARIRDFPDFPHPEGSGGGPDFLRFLLEELIPLIESEYRAKPSDRALYGHSLGGLFGLYALLEGRGTFNRLIIASPSLWWDDRISFEMESKYHEGHASLPARLFLSAGVLEQTDSDEEWAFMVSNLERLIRVLEDRNYAGLDYEAIFFENETHTSVLAPSVSRGLRSIYRDWKDSGSQ